MATLDEAAILALEYDAARQLPDGRWLALRRMMYTTGLFVGLDGLGYRTRFCYEDSRQAAMAFVVWDGQGDPPFNWIKEKGRGVDRMNPRWLADARREMEPT